MIESHAFYMKGTGIVRHPWNCGGASVLQVYQHSSCIEGSAGLVMLQDVSTVN